MINRGLKYTYTDNGVIDGVRISILYEIGDIVWLYFISETVRNKNNNIIILRKKCKIIDVQPSCDGIRFDKYGIETEKGIKSWWHYPTFIEPYIE